MVFTRADIEDFYIVAGLVAVFVIIIIILICVLRKCELSAQQILNRILHKGKPLVLNKGSTNSAMELITKTEAPVTEALGGAGQELRLVLLGNSESGKDQLADILLKRNCELNIAEYCSKSKKAATERSHRTIHVINTSIMCNPLSNEREFQLESLKCIGMSLPEPSAFLFTVFEGHLTNDDQQLFQRFLDTFGEDVLNILFVISIKDRSRSEIKMSNEHLQNIREKCLHEYTVFDIRARKDDMDSQVNLILARILKNRYRECFSNQLFKEAECIFNNSYKNLISTSHHHSEVLKHFNIGLKELDLGRGILFRCILKNLAKHFQERRRREIDDVFREINITDYELRIVIVGLPGSGKSETGNSLLDEKTFPSFYSPSQVTKTCSYKSGERFGLTIHVVDTPHLLLTRDKENINTKMEIHKCMLLTAPGPHAVLFTIKPDRLIKRFEKTVMQLEAIFGSNVWKHVIIIFTGSDSVKSDEDLQDFVEKASMDIRMQEVLLKCNNKFLIFNNKINRTQKENNVKHLLEKIREEILLENENEYYTNPDFLGAEKLLKEKEKIKQRQTESSNVKYRIHKRKKAAIPYNTREILRSEINKKGVSEENLPIFSYEKF